MIFLILSTPESAHGKSAAFVFDNLFIGTIAECNIFLGDTVVASLNVDLVLGNFLLRSGRVHQPANSNFILSDESRRTTCESSLGNLFNDVSGRRFRNVRLRSSLDLDWLGPSSPAEGVLGADSVPVEGVVSETIVTLRQVAGLEALGSGPGLFFSLIPLELEHRDHNALSSSLLTIKVLPVDFNGVTGSIRLTEVS